jgi:uncharacterized membrane protein YfcA
MGFVLSVLGAGGSILTMPILVYLFQIDVLEATSYSLLLVGFTALLSLPNYIKKKLVDLKVGLIFGIPSLIGVVLARKILVPYFPNSMNILGYEFTKNFFIMVLFACLMLVASVLMIRNKQPNLKIKTQTQIRKNIIIILEGFIIGQLTGFVGAGGGFLIIPALVLLTGLEMKIAIGTSLLIIAIKSLVGFSSDYMSGFLVDWTFFIYVIGATLFGVIFGGLASSKIKDKALKKYFGNMILVIGLYIIIEQLVN